MQSLVYLLIVLAGVGVGATGYFGLSFSVVEAFVTTIGFWAIALVLLERTLRRRAEARLERAIEELSRLLATDAQAGAVLGQRINALTGENAGKRLDVVEADISVLGTVVRQVAESVSELEEARKRQSRRDGNHLQVVTAPPASPAEPTFSIDAVRQAIEEERLVFHLQPVVTLPLRKPRGYDLVPRLSLGMGDFAEEAEFMPRHGGEMLLRRIDRLALEQAVALARRARGNGETTIFYLPISRASLVDAAVIEKTVALLEANRVVAGAIALKIPEVEWSAMPLTEKAALNAFVKRGIQLSLSATRSLRLNFGELTGEGVHSVRVDAAAFLEKPESFSDFHTADIVDYLKRFEIDLIATGVTTEDQVLMLLEDGVTLAQGWHIAAPGPAPAELAGDPAAAAGRVRVQA